MADFESFIQKAKKVNIKVVLDFVINHTSKTHPWFKQSITSETNQYRNYYLFSKNPQTDIASGKIPMTNIYDPHHWYKIESGTTDYKYMAFFSAWMPEINYGDISLCENSPTFKAMIDAAKFWIEKGVDGFRLDAVKHIYQNENSNENPEFLRKFYNEIKKIKPDLYMVGEMYSDYKSVAPYYKGCQALFNFESWNKWLSYAIINSHAKWFPKDMMEAESLFKTYRSDFIDATKLSNHDETRTRTTLGGDIEKTKMAAAVLLTSVGSPYIYYGEEIGMLGSTQDAGEDINVREPMKWNIDSKDNYRPTWRKSANNVGVKSVAQQAEESNSILCVYRKFIELRNTYPALASGTIALPQNFNDADDSDKNFMIFYRQSASEKLLVIHNVSPNVNTYTLNSAIKAPIADTKKTIVTKINDSKYTIKMQPYSTIIIEV